MNRPQACEKPTTLESEVRSVILFRGADGRITDLVECRHEAGVVVEGRHDQGVVLLMDVQSGLDVHFRVLEETQLGFHHDFLYVTFDTVTTLVY